MPDEKTQKPAAKTGVTTESASPAGSTSADVAEEQRKNADLLSAAAASSDAAVHNLLGEREIAARNHDDAALKDIDGRLRDLVEK